MLRRFLARPTSGASAANTDGTASAREPHALVAGWFSFEDGHATAGDVLAAEVACEWLQQAGMSYDVALVPTFGEGVDWRATDPACYSHAIFVCGPFEERAPEAAFLERFADCRLIGLNLTFPVSLQQWNPFDLLFERDSPQSARPDITLASRRPLVPVVGVCLVEDYPGEAVRVERANAVIAEALSATHAARVAIDTRLDINETSLRTPSEVESIIARMDVVVTTRLHGMVLALKHGVPVVALDPEAGGAKVRRQAERLGWPLVLNADTVTSKQITDGIAYCLTAGARERARQCARDGEADVEKLRAQFLELMRNSQKWETRFAERVRHANGRAAS